MPKRPWEAAEDCSADVSGRSSDCENEKCWIAMVMKGFRLAERALRSRCTACNIFHGDHSTAPEASETRPNSPFSSVPASQAPGYCPSSPNLHHPCFQWKSYEQQEDHRTGSRAYDQADGPLCRAGTCRGGPAMSRLGWALCVCSCELLY